MNRILLVVFLVACGGDEEDLLERTANTTNRTSRSASTESASTESMSAMVTPPSLTNAERAALALDETVTDALAAAHAAEVGASLCDAAYESAAELVRVVRERFPEDARELPPRELFTSACEQMPENVQRCLLVRYAVEHEEECARAQEALPVADRQRMERLLAGE